MVMLRQVAFCIEPVLANPGFPFVGKQVFSLCIADAWHSLYFLMFLSSVTLAPVPDMNEVIARALR